MSSKQEFLSLEDRVDSLIIETQLKEAAKSKLKRQQDRVMILQEKDIVKSIILEKNKVTKKMKNFFKIGVATGIAALGLATVAPVVAVVAAVAAGYSLIKANDNLKENKLIKNDVKIAKRNVNTMLATLQGGKAGIYQITKRIAQCRKALSLKEMKPIKKIKQIPKLS